MATKKKKKVAKKKPAAKKAAKKKAAPKKAPKKKAKKKAAPQKAAKKQKPSLPDQMDTLRNDGLKVPSKKQRADAVAASAASPQRGKVEAEVLAIFRGCYGGKEKRDEILAIDPNDFDMDPSMFYETLQERFGVPYDDNNEYFGGYGGKVEDTIAFLTARWDGKLRT